MRAVARAGGGGRELGAVGAAGTDGERRAAGTEAAEREVAGDGIANEIQSGIPGIGQGVILYGACRTYCLAGEGQGSRRDTDDGSGGIGALAIRIIATLGVGVGRGEAKRLHSPLSGVAYSPAASMGHR